MPNSIHFEGDVLVIGGGVAGITASLELAEKGFKVYLVEKEPSIGGHMAKLDKTFPTLDCSICILGPKMVEVARHPNIKLFSYSEIKEVEHSRENSRFVVKIIRKPRYVDESKCTGCRRCEEKCPIKIPSEFEEGMGVRKAIYVPFPQAVPNSAIIDREHCLYFTKGVCKICEKMCPAGAINFEQEPDENILTVYSIIVSTGFALLDPSILPQYGYGRFPNVLTSIQYERLMNAAGPTHGEIVRPSDKKHPKNVAIVQCVGSRSRKLCDYCSQICCMYATKQAIVTKEHDPNTDVIIFYNDINASGKGHEELVRRAIEKYDVKYVKGLPSEILWDEKNGKLIIRYADLPNGEVKTLDADLVVLCPALTPPKDLSKLANILGIELNEYGFIKTINHNSVETSFPGIYVCGACQGPKDISHSVVQALAAAAEATRRIISLKKEHGILPSEHEYSKVDVVEDRVEQEPRIGVFVCHCGLNIASVVNVKEVVEDASSIPNVVYAKDLVFACSKDGVENIKEAIKKHGLNRVIVASCTPSTHEKLFRNVCEEAGLNQYLFEMVNIREQVSWVHRRTRREATDKAKELVKMAVAKARLLKPLKKIEAPVTPSALVIGGTISGLIAAKTIADSGFKVHLIESGEKLGSDLDLYQYDSEISEFISELVEYLNKHDSVEINLSTKIDEVKGSIGNFTVKLIGKDTAREVTVGTMIVASNGEELKPSRMYYYGEDSRVSTLAEFRKKHNNIDAAETLAFILCVNAREKTGRTYCSAICCEEALKQALNVKTMFPESDIYILYRDIRLPLNGERLYRKLREAGVKFIRYEIDQPPELTLEDGRPVLNVYDTTTDIELEIPVDKVVLATPIIPSGENHEISSKLKIPLNSFGFFLEAHPKLRPVDFSVDGIFLCGLSYAPQRLEDSILEGLASASRALTPLILGRIVTEPVVAEVNPSFCVGCGRCQNVCEFGAIKLEVTQESTLIAKVNPLLCKGCGSCSAECPAKAITINCFSNNQILAMIEAAFEKPSPNDRPKIISFFCNWCGYAAADMAGVSRYEYPPTIEIIRVMCSARVDPLYILYSLLLGADGVLVVGCHPGNCHYISGNLAAKDRIAKIKKLIEVSGLEPERVRIEWASAGEGLRLSKIIEEFTHKIEEIGYNPFRRSS